jgi:hypothetical protein
MSFLLTHGGVRALYPTDPKGYLNAMGEFIKASDGGKIDALYLPPELPDPAKPPPLFEARFPNGFDHGMMKPFVDFISQVPHEYVVCSLQHPHTTNCAPGIWRAAYGEWWRALSLYAPLNAVCVKNG